MPWLYLHCFRFSVPKSLKSLNFLQKYVVSFNWYVLVVQVNIYFFNRNIHSFHMFFLYNHTTRNSLNISAALFCIIFASLRSTSFHLEFPQNIWINKSLVSWSEVPIESGSLLKKSFFVTTRIPQLKQSYKDMPSYRYKSQSLGSCRTHRFIWNYQIKLQRKMNHAYESQ